MIAIDQPHNQNIAVIKAYRGTIGVTEIIIKLILSLSFFQYFLTYSQDFRRVFLLPSYKWVSLVGRMSLYSAKRVCLVKR